MTNPYNQKIYIAGKLSAPTFEGMEKNVYTAIDAWIEVYKKGHFPYLPHTTFFVNNRATQHGVNIPWEDWLTQDKVWLDLCDALLYLSPSTGADLEKNMAEKLGKKIYYAITEIPTVKREIPPDVQKAAKAKPYYAK